MLIKEKGTVIRYTFSQGTSESRRSINDSIAYGKQFFYNETIAEVVNNLV
jgi:hypothetical protein